MSWDTLNPTIRTTAEQTLTPRQLQALKLNHAGYSDARIALTLDISEPAARRLRIRAHQRLAIALRKDTA